MKWCFLSLGVWDLRWVVKDLKGGYGISLYTRHIEAPTVLQCLWHHTPGCRSRMISWEEFWSRRLEFELFSYFLASCNVWEMERQVTQSLMPDPLLVLFWFHKEWVWTVRFYIFLLRSIPLYREIIATWISGPRIKLQFILTHCSLACMSPSNIFIAFWCQLNPKYFRLTDIMFFSTVNFPSAKHFHWISICAVK